MSQKRWTLAGQLTRWSVLTAVVLVLIGSALGSWYVRKALDGELVALHREELAEVAGGMAHPGRTPGAFRALAEALQAEHPEYPMAWRTWNLRTGEIWAEAGSPALLERFVPRQHDGAPPTDGTHRWGTEPLFGDITIGLLLDGSKQAAILQRYGMFSLVVLLLAGLWTAVSGTLLGRRVAGMLRRIADHARAGRAPSEDPELEVASVPEEVREVSEALSEMLRNIRGESERSRLLTTGIAHELRSPIQNLLVETEVTLMRPRSIEDYVRTLESLHVELRDLGRVVDNLVTLCSSQPTGVVSAKEEFDVGQEADLRLAKERQEAARHGVELELHLHGNLSFRGDREALLLALRNLVGNAIEWSPRGEVVKVDLTGGDDDVHFTVEDAGPGVPEELCERIFEPFYRGPAASGRRVGYGLGLALSRAAVEAHGGKIRVSASGLGGARFDVDLPRYRRVEQLAG